LPTGIEARFREKGIEVETPDNRSCRTALGAEVMGATFPCLLDAADQAVCKRYASFPQRLFVLDSVRRIRFDADRGLSSPWDFRAIRGCLDELLHRNSPDNRGFTTPPPAA
jgi:hypothetical protein